MTHEDFGPGARRFLHRLDDLTPPPADFDRLNVDAALPEHHPGRRALLAAASVIVVLTAVAGLWWRDSSTSTTLSEMPAGTTQPTAPNVVLPPSLPTSTTAPDLIATVPSTSLPETEPDNGMLPTFTRLAPGTLPEGFTFESAVWEDLGDDIGYAMYATSSDDVSFDITIRGVADFFGQQTNLGEPISSLGGRPVFIDTGNGTCAPQWCSVGVQWDENTAVSVSFTSASSGLDPATSIEPLLAILESLEPSTSTWVRGSLEEYFAQDGVGCASLPDGVLPLVLTEIPDGYQLEYAHYEETPDGPYSAAVYQSGGGPEAGGSHVSIISRPTPMWETVTARPIVSDTGPFVLRDASQIEGGLDNDRAVGFEVDGPNYVTVAVEGPDAMDFSQLAVLAHSLFAQCSAYQPGLLVPE